MSRRILVTTALPYTNGPIHAGHLLEHVQSDIWVRYQRLRGNECIYVCADDTHGTATMLKAERDGVDPEVMIEGMRQEHVRDFKGFHIDYDNYYSTHSEENRELCELIYGRLVECRPDLSPGTWSSSTTPSANMFLADRFVKGGCPRCGAEDQNGDNCDACGATYNAIELKKPPLAAFRGGAGRCRSSPHYFFDLPQVRGLPASDWTRSGTVQPEVANKLAEWLDAGLRAWDISRDAPYFGFLVPGTDRQVLLRVDGCAHRLHGQLQEPGRCRGRGPVRGLLGSPEAAGDHRGAPLHRQGHRQLPRALLAGGAGRLGLPHAHPHPHPRFHHRQRRQDVQVEGHPDQCRDLPSKYIDPECLRYYYATKLNGTDRRFRHQLRRLRAAGEQRPGRQDREHREPLCGLHRQAVRRAALGGTARPRGSGSALSSARGELEPNTSRTAPRPGACA